MRTKISNKKRDGFAGELLISIPQNVLAGAIQKGQILPHQLYVSHIGYFPKALYHYCQRPQGCVDNILFYCVQGKGYYTLDGHTFTLNPNQYVIVPATDKPLVYWSDTEDTWVHFTSDALQAFNRAYHIVPEQGPQYIPHNEKGIRIWEEMYENLSRGYSPENLMNTNLCLYHLIATFVFSQQQNQNSSSPEKAIIRETIDYMKNNLDKTIRIEDLNKYSVSHFSKLFRLTTGMSPIEYFIHLKMQKACQLLYTEDSRVKQIAALLGYDDPYYFSRLFKKYMNTSPGTYRKSVRKIH